MIEHPQTILLKADNANYTKNITEGIVWQYYDDMKAKIIPYLKGLDLFIVVKAGKKELYLRKPFDKSTEFIRVNNTKDFDKINIGRMIEVHVTAPRKVDYFVLDLDPGSNLIWGDIKRGTLQLHDFLKSTEKLKDIKIHYTGVRSFHIWCYLKGGKKDIDAIREEWVNILEEKFKDSKFHIVNKQTPGKNQLNIDFSPVGFNKGHITPYSLRAKTGLVCVEVSAKNLSKFKKKDATLDKIYKDMLGKKFDWEIKDEMKKSYDIFKIAMEGMYERYYF